jgi:hypothetical protein
MITLMFIDTDEQDAEDYEDIDRMQRRRIIKT